MSENRKIIMGQRGAKKTFKTSPSQRRRKASRKLLRPEMCQLLRLVHWDRQDYIFIYTESLVLRHSPRALMEEGAKTCSNLRMATVLKMNLGDSTIWFSNAGPFVTDKRHIADSNNE